MLYWSRDKSWSRIRKIEPVNYEKPYNSHALALACSLFEVSSFVLTGMILENIVK